MMRIKSLFLLLAISSILLSGCGVFQKVQKNKEDHSLIKDSTLVATYSQTDTGSVLTRRTWFGITPQIEAAVLKSFEAVAAAGSAVAAANLKGSTTELSSATQNLGSANLDLLNLLQKNGIGFEESIFDRKGLSNSGSVDQATSLKEEKSNSSKLKEPDKKVILIIAGTFVLLLLIFIIAGIWYARRIANKVSELNTIFETIKP